VPTLRMVGDAHDIVIDGKLDDEYWQKCPTAATGRLRELQTGREPIYGTQIKSGWAGNSVYFAIRCQEKPGDKPIVAATKKDDPAIWYGDLVELLIETDEHSYYQIAVNPAGAVVDYDRGADKSGWAGWESQAEVATNMADDHWTVEIRLPVTDDQNDPLNQLVGNKPTQSLPWHINVCRQRLRGDVAEHSAFSPTGTAGFHDVMRFAYFYDGKSRQFEADPTVTNYLTESRAASQLLTEKKPDEALAAFTALADGRIIAKITDLQKSAALKQAAAAARVLKDYARADELAARIPIAAERKNAVMHNLLAQRKSAELLAQFGGEDLTKWPFWAAGEGHYARGRAYAAVGDKAKATVEFNAALALTSDKRAREDILAALGKESGR
jgi:tetratricopeptide (TPR) repeat protein